MILLYSDLVYLKNSDSKPSHLPTTKRFIFFRLLRSLDSPKSPFCYVEGGQKTKTTWEKDFSRTIYW